MADPMTLHRPALFMIIDSISDMWGGIIHY